MKNNIWKVIANISTLICGVILIVYFFFRQYLSEDSVIYLKIIGGIGLCLFLLSKLLNQKNENR
jgi:hypothetical protein